MDEAKIQVPDMVSALGMETGLYVSLGKEARRADAESDQRRDKPLGSVQLPR